METSPDTKEITAAVLAFHARALVIGKDSENPTFKSGPRGSASKYASLAHILEGIAGPLAECGLGFVQFPDGESLTTRLLHRSGEWMQASVTMRPTQNTPQAHGSAITYARRYALVAILGLRIDGDDDGNAASAPAPPAPSAAEALEAGRQRLQAARSLVELKEAWGQLPKFVADALKADKDVAKARIEVAIAHAAATPLA